MTIDRQLKKAEDQARLAMRLAWLGLILFLLALGARGVSCYAKSQLAKPAEAVEQR